MRFNEVPELAINLLFGRLLRRSIGAALLALFALIAVYHFTIAGTLALDAEFGALYARLIVAAIYTAAALVALIVLWATRTRSPVTDATAAALSSPRNAQMVMLIEAVMLGYSLARKSGDRVR
jgi:hypothetical protein